ncbi:MAG: cysteine desulfurase [Lachnospiraceae bacterium]|nr:cysteine desulfurase [Lachnospiraceae bacterium]
MNPYRKDFPILDAAVKGRPLVYLDNAATMQMPKQVMEAMMNQQSCFHSNVHRGIHSLSELSTRRMEEAREHIAGFIGAESASEIIFTSGTTAGINMAARSFIDTFLQPGEEIISTQMEHHSNYLPWRETSPEKQGVFLSCPIDRNGDLDMDAFSSLLSPRTLIVAVTYVSNVTGAVNPVKEIIKKAHIAGAAVLLDCAQAMRHEKIDVRDLDCDFCVFSGHKIGGPTGTGILYGKSEMLELMKPVLYGGGTVREVTDRVTAYEDVPYRFEAGTPNITGIIGLDAAVSYLENTGIENISETEKELLSLTEEILAASDRVNILGKPKERAGAISFTVDGLGSFDVAKLLDTQGIAVRSGHHCAMPLHQAYGIDGSVRISPAFYNTPEEIGQFETTMKRILGMQCTMHN